MPTPQQLADEITNDPTGIGYAVHVATGNDTAIAEALNTKSFRGPVPIIDLSAYCTVNGITGMVTATANNQNADQSARNLCFGVLSILENNLRLNNADLDAPAFDLMTDGLIAFSLLTSEQKTAIFALGDNRYSRAEVLWGPGAVVGHLDVALALGRG